jgi:hypothetical protein
MPKQPTPDEPESFDAALESVVPKGAKFEGSYGGLVKVRVTKFGYGHVSTGEHIPGHGDKLADANSVLEVDKSVAEQLEAKGYAEIVE